MDHTFGRAEEIFDEVIKMPVSDREGLVERRCGDDAKLKAEVAGLLEARQQMGEFLERPALSFEGKMFGAYRAAEEIGRGGMSVVYRGERVDGDFTKRVAIKVILSLTPGSLAQSETQILASLEHPHIARLLDAGQSDWGFRYLVMEYAEGERATEAARHWSEEEKLRLLLQICSAVQYAHRNLVVHRDLKPTNILVDKSGAAKLLDFGIAKMLMPDAGNEQTSGVQAYTADYASPEQILGGSVTTAADVYSLGVLLCALAGGRTPRKLEGLGIAELIDKAKNEEVEDVPLSGDLALIARKALRRDPNERYESAAALAADLEAYLKGMPVAARQPSWTYRWRKFAWRNKYSVGAATIAAAALALTAGIAMGQARLAERRFDEVRSLAKSVMFELHDVVSPLPGSLAARKLIAEKSLTYLDALSRDAAASEPVQIDVARGYLRLAEIEGKDQSATSLGNSSAALERSRQAIVVARKIVAKNARSKQGRELLIDALDSAANAERLRGEFKQAIALGDEEVANARLLVAAAPSADNKERLAMALKNLGQAKLEVKATDATSLQEESIVLRRQLYEADPKNRDRMQRLSEGHGWLAASYWREQKLEPMEPHARAAYKIAKELYAVDPRGRNNVSTQSNMLAMMLLRQKKFEEAIGLQLEAMKLREAMAAEDPRNASAALRVVSILDRIGYSYFLWGRYPEAIGYGQQSLTKGRSLVKIDPANTQANREVILALVDLAQTYEKAKQPKQACPLVAEAGHLMKQPIKGLFPFLQRQAAIVERMEETCGEVPRTAKF